jgi:peptidoglycan/LPS O-acetylase OafA/YrhL
MHAGNLGVDLFFVLSGFLIGRIIVREVDATSTLDVLTFWRRRWLRTLPAYLAMFALLLASGAVVHSASPWIRPWAFLIFLQNYLSVGGRFNWSWSLCVEEHFYLCLPILTNLLLSRVRGLPFRTGLRVLALSALLLSVFSRWYVIRATHPSDWVDYMQDVYCPTHTRLDGLAVGVLLSSLPRFRLSRFVAYLSLASGLLMVGAAVAWFRFLTACGQVYFVAAVGDGLIMLSMLGYERWMDARVPASTFIAGISYSLYLVHPAVFAVIEARKERLGVLAWPLAFTTSLLAAYALRRLVELPVLRLRDRRLPEVVRVAE